MKVFRLRHIVAILGGRNVHGDHGDSEGRTEPPGQNPPRTKPPQVTDEGAVLYVVRRYFSIHIKFCARVYT